MSNKNEFHLLLAKLIRLVTVLIVLVAGATLLWLSHAAGFLQLPQIIAQRGSVPSVAPAAMWHAPDTTSIPVGGEGDLIRYGRELVAHTAAYLGPNGSVAQISNGMNCQNCHLKAGTVPFGNNYGAVASSYPKFRSRSGTVEGFEKRVNDCIERSLNGQPLDPESLEMKAIVGYIKWVGKDTDTKQAPKGLGMAKLPFPDRPASPVKGKLVYDTYCGRCHRADGEGVKAANGREYLYPPLFGSHSYNTGAGIYRLSTFASFIKANMPYGVTWENPFLSDEEAWDVAAYVNAMPRPAKDLSSDWPDLSKKPFDHPFGPYNDPFSEEQHKFGPFGPIVEAAK